MKNTLLLILIALSINAFVQGNLNISAGMGFPELMNLEARYQMKQIQLGVSYGFWPVTGENVASLSGDV